MNQSDAAPRVVHRHGFRFINYTGDARYPVACDGARLTRGARARKQTLRKGRRVIPPSPMYL